MADITKVPREHQLERRQQTNRQFKLPQQTEGERDRARNANETAGH